jgi:hypothetical protein
MKHGASKKFCSGEGYSSGSVKVGALKVGQQCSSRMQKSSAERRTVLCKRHEQRANDAAARQ